MHLEEAKKYLDQHARASIKPLAPFLRAAMESGDWTKAIEQARYRCAIGYSWVELCGVLGLRAYAWVQFHRAIVTFICLSMAYVNGIADLSATDSDAENWKKLPVLYKMIALGERLKVERWQRLADKCDLN